MTDEDPVIHGTNELAGFPPQNLPKDGKEILGPSKNSMYESQVKESNKIFEMTT